MLHHLIFIFLLIFQVANATEIKKVITLTPSLAETFSLFQDSENKLVGVSEYTDYPPNLLKKEKIGGYNHLNYEKIMTLNADLILAAKGGNSDFEVEILKKKFDHKLLILRENSFEDFIENIDLIGKKINRIEEALKIKSEYIIQKDKIFSRNKKRQQKSVAILIEESPLLFAGGPTYFTQLLKWVGAKNTFEDLNVKYPRLSKEEVIKRKPDFVIVLGKVNLNQMKWTEFIKNTKFVFIKNDAFLRPGPRLLEAAIELEKIIYENKI